MAKILPMFTLQQATKAQMGSRYSSTLSLTSELDGGGWSAPRPGRFTPGKRPSTHCIGSRVGSRAGLDGRGKPRLPRDSNPGASSP